MKKINLLFSIIFLFGFSQLILVYKNFKLMNKITNLEEKKNMLVIKIKKEEILLDSLSTFVYSLLYDSLEMKSANTFSTEIVNEVLKELPEPVVAKKENGKE
jgi:hypothetical protein